MKNGYSDDLTKYYGFNGRSTGNIKLKNYSQPKTKTIIATTNDAKYEDIQQNKSLAQSQETDATIRTRANAIPASNCICIAARKPIKNVRPSLSEQLAAIGDKADALTKTIRENAGMKPVSDVDRPLFTTPSTNFNVGRLACRFPSPVHFYTSRVEYTFHHPYEATEIAMVMYYQDMSQVVLSDSSSSSPFRLSFRVPRRLIHFGDDYDPSKSDSVVTIDLPTGLAVNQIRRQVLPLITNGRIRK